MTVIAIVLFITLCPCISYIIVKRWLIPWRGGVSLVMGDNSLFPINFTKGGTADIFLPVGSMVKGVFLAGARANMMPSVSFRKLLRDRSATLTEKAFCYRTCEKENGVYYMCCEPMDSQRFTLFLLDISAPYPWKHYYSYGEDGYYGFVQINFDDSTNVEAGFFGASP